MLTSAAPIAYFEDDDMASSLLALDGALLRAARECGVWFDQERQRPCVLIDGMPVGLPRPTKVGECSRSVHVSTHTAVAGFKHRVIEALSPGIGDRRMRHFLALVSREGKAGHSDTLGAALRSVAETGALALAWRLAEIPEARQRPPLSLGEHAFEGWLSAQVPDASGAIIVRERQARIDVERIAGEELQLRAIRKLAEWYGFRRVHAPRARLLIRP